MGSTLTVDTIQGATTAANVKLPSGGVVGQKTVAAATSTQFNTNTYTLVTGMEIAYAPKFSTSKLMFMIQCHMFFGQYQNSWASVSMRLRNTTDGANLHTDIGYGTGKWSSDASDREMAYLHLLTEYAPGATSSKTYQLQVAKIQGSGAGSGFDANNQNYGGGGRITILEIAQ